MLACLDVYYFDDGANSAALLFDTWASSTATKAYTEFINDVADYQPGEFYRRELDPLMRAVQTILEPIEVYVIDAYCHLDDEKSPGLGKYFSDSLQDSLQDSFQDSLQDSFRKSIPVFGVAKNRFHASTHAAEVLRGESDRPLFVTAIGIRYEEAAAFVQSMNGDYRFPTLLKQVDKLAREKN